MISHQRAITMRGSLLVAVSVLLSAVLGCSTPAQNSGQASDKAQTFTVPQEQMAHLQIVTVAPTSIPRSLRLTGAVAFNAFNTTPVITQIGGPVSRIVVTPGQQVRRGEPLLYVASPDYSQLLANYLKARDAFHLADKSYLRSKDLYDHHAVAERDLEAAESTRAQASADLGAAEQALKILGISRPEEAVGRPAASEIPGAGSHCWRSRGTTSRARAGDPGRRYTGFHDLQYEFCVGAGQCLSERLAIRSPW